MVRPSAPPLEVPAPDWFAPEERTRQVRRESPAPWALQRVAQAALPALPPAVR
jgi:hypothetical protein